MTFLVEDHTPKSNLKRNVINLASDSGSDEDEAFMPSRPECSCSVLSSSSDDPSDEDSTSDGSDSSCDDTREPESELEKALSSGKSFVRSAPNSIRSTHRLPLALQPNKTTSTLLTSSRANVQVPAAAKIHQSKNRGLWPALDEFYVFILTLHPRTLAIVMPVVVVRPVKPWSTHQDSKASAAAYVDEFKAKVLVECHAQLLLSRGGAAKKKSTSLSLVSMSDESSSSRGSGSCFKGELPTTLIHLYFELSKYHTGGTFSTGEVVRLTIKSSRGHDTHCFLGIVLSSSVVASEEHQLPVLVYYQNETTNSQGLYLTPDLLHQTLGTKWILTSVGNIITGSREYQALDCFVTLPLSLQHSILGCWSNTTDDVVRHPASSGLALTGSPALSSALKRLYNPSQRDAIKTVMSSDADLQLIQGPPGTGLIEYIKVWSNVLNLILLFCIRKNTHDSRYPQCPLSRIWSTSIIDEASSDEIKAKGTKDPSYRLFLSLYFFERCKKKTHDHVEIHDDV